MDGDIKNLISMIEDAISDAFLVLEGDEDTIYVKSYDTKEHYSIKIRHCM